MIRQSYKMKISYLFFPPYLRGLWKKNQQIFFCFGKKKSKLHLNNRNEKLHRSIFFLNQNLIMSWNYGSVFQDGFSNYYINKGPSFKIMNSQLIELDLSKIIH